MFCALPLKQHANIPPPASWTIAQQVQSTGIKHRQSMEKKSGVDKAISPSLTFACDDYVPWAHMPLMLYHAVMLGCHEARRQVEKMCNVMGISV